MVAGISDGVEGGVNVTIKRTAQSSAFEAVPNYGNTDLYQFYVIKLHRTICMHNHTNKSM